MIDRQAAPVPHPLRGRASTHEGRLLGARRSSCSRTAACRPICRGAILDRALFHLDNAYFVPALRFEGRVAQTNLPSNTAFRGFGGPQGMVVIEDDA